MDNTVNTLEIEKSKAYITVEIIEYLPNAVVSKTIIKKSTGNISIMSFDSGEGLTERATLSTLLLKSLMALPKL